MLYLHHEIYEDEDDVPILVHVFPGKTEEEARNVLAIHATWDAFLKAAITTGTFRGSKGAMMKLTVNEFWTEVR